MKRVLVIIAVLTVLVATSVIPVRGEAITITQDISYGSDPQQRFDIYQLGTRGTNRSAVVFIHGGGWNAGDDEQLAAYAMDFVARTGMVVFNITYRTLQPARFANQPYDVSLAINTIRANADLYGISVNHLGVWGSSAGGHLALLEVYKNRGVKAVASWSAPSDLSSIVISQGCPHTPCQPGNAAQFAANLVQMFEDKCHLSGCFAGNTAPCTGNACQQRYTDTSPTTYINTGDPPTFLAHHTNDMLVPFSQFQLLRDGLQRAGVALQSYTPTGLDPSRVPYHGWTVGEQGWTKTVNYLSSQLRQ